jgi:hypothetical protein
MAEYPLDAPLDLVAAKDPKRPLLSEQVRRMIMDPQTPL